MKKKSNILKSMSRPRNVRVPGDDTGGVQEPSFPILHDSLRRAQKEATVVRTPRGLEPAYTPRRSGRFDQIGVLTTLSSAPLLPSPALTPRQGPTDVSTNFGPQVLLPLEAHAFLLCTQNRRSAHKYIS
jgi:hypothetical protein